MRTGSMTAMQVDRQGRIVFAGLIAMTAAAALLLGAAPAAAQSAAGKMGQNVTLESVAGSTVKRLVLAAKAAERLGIETGKVSDEPIVRKQMVGGVVVPPPPAQPPVAKAPTGFATVSAFSRSAAVSASPLLATGTPSGKPVNGEVWVRVSLSPEEVDKLDAARPAHVRPLAYREAGTAGVTALPSKMPPVADSKHAMQAFHYVVPGANHGFAHWQRVRVELQHSGSGQKQKVVPYSAVVYDTNNGAWVYTNPASLTYVRQPIAVKEIVGDFAILSDGPPVGTSVVTVGAILLYGAERQGK